MSDAWALLAQDTYKGIIDGVVYGPHTVRRVFCSESTDPIIQVQDVSLRDFVAFAPDAYDVRLYPDVCHTIYSQYAIDLVHRSKTSNA
jgi:hypothetical protein